MVNHCTKDPNIIRLIDEIYNTADNFTPRVPELCMERTANLYMNRFK